MGRRGAALTALLLGVLPTLAWACPTCKNGLQGNPEAEGFAYGIFLSIVVMLGAMFSAIGFLIWKLVKMARTEAEAAAAHAGPGGPGSPGGAA